MKKTKNRISKRGRINEGRPVKYNSVEEIRKKIDTYFAGHGGKGQMPPTVTGLANALNLTREGLIGYGVKEEFNDTIKKAKGKIEEFLETRLYSKTVAGVIFNLKNNYHWKDVQDTNLTGQLDFTFRHIAKDGQKLLT